MPRPGRLLRLMHAHPAPAACAIHGGAPRSDACPRCLADSVRRAAAAIRSDGPFTDAERRELLADFERQAAALDAEWR